MTRFATPALIALGGPAFAHADGTLHVHAADSGAVMLGLALFATGLGWFAWARGRDR